MAVRDLNKCPACGAMRSSFEAVCPECGYEFTDIRSSQTIQEFTDKIAEYDRQILEEEKSKEKPGTGVWTVIGWIFIFPFMFGRFVFKKMQAKHAQLEGVEKLKSESIRNFPIPNSREDLLEFAFYGRKPGPSHFLF